MQLSNTHTNNMGTISFDAKMQGMRKPQDFIVYPMQADGDNTKARIQSDKRSGYIDLISGEVELCAGAYFLGHITSKDKMTGEQLVMLKAKMTGTASAKAGRAVVFSDNSASGVLSLGGLSCG